MARRSSTSTTSQPNEVPATETTTDSIVEETAETAAPEPKVVELKTTTSEESVPAAPASPEQIHAQITEKLSNRSLEGDAFVPKNSASLETAAKQVAEEQGFAFNRGTSVGARLIARSQGHF
jgi:hypothetical protein